MRLLGALIALGAILFVGADYVAEFLAVDVCLDAGYVYDYATSTCNKEAEHLSYVSYVERNGKLLVVAAFGVLVGLVVWAKAKGKNS
ncbi:MAG: hypothetical protein RBT75_14065 [Anaerolineae bacterium]|jgi:hypothetical protein|nr:hypothetical protein [Anaerolineae bacterium]